GRPGHVPTAEQVDVQVVDALTAVLAGVDDGAVAGLGYPLLTRYRHSQHHHAADEVRVVEIIQRPDVLFRDDQNVGGRLRIDVAEGEHLFVVHDHLRGDFPARDLTEDASLRFSHSI